MPHLRQRLTQQIGLLRSLIIYYRPWKNRQLADFYAQFIGPGDLCFDIGAHVGNRLWAWTRLGARCIGVEPQPHLAAYLRRRYGDHPDIVLVDQALGSEPGSATLHISRANPTVTTLSQRWIDQVQRTDAFAKVAWDDTVTVPVTTLDALIAQHGLPAFCKIDVEGFELAVLRGLSQPIPALSFEVVLAGGADALADAVACLDWLCELGAYRFNWSPGESHQLALDGWVDRQAMADFLGDLPVSANSGDVYAKLFPPSASSGKKISSI